ncbi:unnamed protein product [Cunninghamella echinulata]
MLSKIISKEQENPHPLTTEEPIHHDHLIDFIQHLNEMEPALISPATLEEKHEPNKFFTPDLTNLSKDSLTLNDTTSDDTDNDNPQLLLTTEANRHIPPLHRKSISKNPIIEHRCDRYVVTHIYGAGPQGNQYIQEEDYGDGDEEDDHDHKRTNFEINIKTTVGRPLCTKKKARSYMVACDFSKESYYAMEWVMGTMMRDGDELHIVAAVNREDNPEVVKKTGLSLKSELQMGSNKITQAAKDTLNQMLLYNIKLVTHTIAGRIKSVLYQMIKEKSFNLVVCGSRGRSSVKGLFMGSISSYLVHKSPVPVSVIQMDKKKKKEKQKPSKKVKKPTPLSESVKTGKLTVDELSLQKKK